MRKVINIQQSTNTFDEVLKRYGSIDYLFHFLGLNTKFTNIISPIAVTEKILIDDFRFPKTVADESVIITSDIQVQGKENQSIFDILVRYYGDISKVVEILNLNPQINSVNDIIVNKNILVKDPNNQNISVKFYNDMKSVLVTGISAFAIAIIGKSFNISFNKSYH